MITAVTLAGCVGAGSQAASDPHTVTVALDYYGNNANFAGFYVAQAKGYYSAAGLTVKIQPFTTTASDVTVSSGQAQFGTHDQPTTEINQATGTAITAIAAFSQHYQNTIAVSPARAQSVTTPAQLADLTYGGFGSSVETALNDAVIIAAGGKPHYKTVTLGANAYAELDSGQVDFAQPYTTDDVLWHQIAGHPWKTFNPLDYGFPDSAGALLFGSNAFITAHPDITRAFVKATLQGYSWAQQNPQAAVDVQISAKIGPMDANNNYATARLLAQKYWLPVTGAIGTLDPSQWTKFTAFAFRAGLLKDANGKTLTTAPDPTKWYTNKYLPGGG